MKKVMLFRLAMFVLLTVLVRILFDGLLRIPFWGEFQSESFLLAFAYSAGPDLIFASVAGVVFAIAFRGTGLVRPFGPCLVSLIIAQIAYLTTTSSTKIYSAHWQAYLHLAAPYVGTLIGFIVGTLIGGLAIGALRNLPMSTAK